jgi:hypothetical protein
LKCIIINGDSLQAINLQAKQLENDMGEMVKVSFDKDQISAAKRALVNDRPYADRISLAFAVQLLRVKTDLKEDHFVLDEINYLEGVGPRSRTKPEEQFRHPPLRPFWHKHYSAPRHFLKNIGIRWNLSGGGNRDLQSMLYDVAERHGKDLDRWQGIATHGLSSTATKIAPNGGSPAIGSFLRGMTGRITILISPPMKRAPIRNNYTRSFAKAALRSSHFYLNNRAKSLITHRSSRALSPTLFNENPPKRTL